MTGYSSPFSDRYGTETMREAWSRQQRVVLLFNIWTNHHNQMAEDGGIPLAKIVDPILYLTEDKLDALIGEIDEMEKEVGHDIVAHLRVFANHVPEGIPVLAHAGLTSSDILDQAVLAQTLFSLFKVYQSVRELTADLCAIEHRGEDKKWLVGRTHLQPAEPTTLLHRFLLYIQDLSTWLHQAEKAITELDRYRGLMSGSVGNYRNEVFAMTGFESRPKPIHRDKRLKSQTLPRYLDLMVASLLDQLAAILHKAAFDYRLESGFGNTYEGASANRVGSSAMPYKRNPINAECINSLARHIHHLCGNAWDNAAWQGLDRTLDDSANRRAWLPEAFIATSEIVRRSFVLFDDYTNIESINPEDWEHLWEQSRERAFNVVNRAAVQYGQPENTPFFDGVDEKYADAMDNQLLCRFKQKLLKHPSWWERLNVPAPWALIRRKTS